MLAERRAFVPVPEHTKTPALSVLRVGFARFNIPADGQLNIVPRSSFASHERKESLMKKVEIKSLLIGAVLAVVIMFAVAATPRRGNKTVWEYKVVTASAYQDELGKAINSSVGEGWDFVSASGPSNENWGMAVLRREKK